MDNFEHALEKANAMLRTEMERLTRERDAALRIHAANVEAGIELAKEFNRVGGIGYEVDGVFRRARALLALFLSWKARAEAAEAENAAMRSVLERVEYCQTSGPMDEMHCPECGDTRSATCLPRHHDACDLGRALHGSSNPGAALLERLESAERWMGVVRDELVNAGGRPGDRDVALANLRSLLELHAAVRQYQHRDEADAIATFHRLMVERRRAAECIPPEQVATHNANWANEMREQQRFYTERLRAAEASAKAWEEQHKQTERLRRAQGDRLDAAIAVVESARAFCGEPEILAALAAYDAAKEGV